MIVGWVDAAAMWVEFALPENERDEIEVIAAERSTTDEDGGSAFVLFRRRGALFLATFADDPAFPTERVWKPRPVRAQQATAFVSVQTRSEALRDHALAALGGAGASRAVLPTTSRDRPDRRAGLPARRNTAKTA